MRRFGIEAAEDFPDLGEFVHQFALVLKAARRIDDQHVGADLGCLLYRIEHDRSRVAAFWPAHERHADPLRPGLQLTDGGRAEGIARRQHHGVIVFLEKVRELGDGRRLAAAVHADHQQYLRAGKGGDFERYGDGAQDSGDFLCHGFLQLPLRNFEAEALFAQLFANARGCRRAEVGQDQRILDIVQRGIVQPRSAHHLGQVARQFLGGLAEAPEQPVGPALLVTHCRRPFSKRVGDTVITLPAGVPSGRDTRAKCGV